MSEYLNKKELLQEILISKEQDKLTDRAIELLLRMIKEMTRNLRYKNPMDKEDCMSEAIFDVLKYWKNFNPNLENSNVFAYFTQIGKMGLAKGLKRLYKVNNMDMVSLNSDHGIYNF